VEDAPVVKAAGFDFVEVNVQQVLQGLASDAEFAPTAKRVLASPLPIEAANALVPGNLPVVGPQRDLAALLKYLNTVAQRAGQLGIGRLVFGSGAARKRPDSVSPDLAFDQIVEFTRMAGDACARHRVTLVIEHLNRNETNTINSLEQERRLCEQVNHPAVATLVDTYHYGLENETDADLLELNGTLQHVHVAEPVDRIQPGGHTDPAKAFDFDTFFSLLRKMGYDQRISFEGKWSGSLETDGARCVKFLREAWDRAGNEVEN
jgi:sugar phosphate isomerase/epimerase